MKKVGDSGGYVGHCECDGSLRKFLLQLPCDQSQALRRSVTFTGKRESQGQFEGILIRVG